MRRKIAKKFKSLAVVCALIFIISFFIFTMVDYIPGNPAVIQMEIQADAAAITKIMQEMGLDRPILWRYLLWISNAICGDLGLSYTYKIPVTSMIYERLMVTVPLVIVSVVIATIVGIALGIWAAVHKDSQVDLVAVAWVYLGSSIPIVCLGILLILLASSWGACLPTGGWPAPGDSWLGFSSHMILPMLAVSLPQVAIIARVTRVEAIAVLEERWLVAARAKGVQEHKVIVCHVLPNIAHPIIAAVKMQTGQILAGTVVIEQVFNLPGLGSLIVNAIMQHDTSVINGAILVLLSFVFALSIIADELQENLGRTL